MPSPFLVDSHCHLDAEQFAGEPTAELLSRAAAAGVARCLSIGTSLATSRAAVELATAHAPVFATVGLDPGETASYDAAARAELARLATHPKVLAIGEIGLDYHWMVSPPERQQAVFQDQLDLAASLGLPVVIHCREAHGDCERMLTRWADGLHRGGWPGDRPVGVMHCYSGELAEAERELAALLDRAPKHAEQVSSYASAPAGADAPREPPRPAAPSPAPPSEPVAEAANDLESASKAEPSTARDACSAACDAGAAIARAVERICELDGPEGARCERAKTRLDEARARLARQCPSCSP